MKRGLSSDLKHIDLANVFNTVIAAQYL